MPNLGVVLGPRAVVAFAKEKLCKCTGRKSMPKWSNIELPMRK